MRILVCLKSVPREIVRVKVSEAGDRVPSESHGQTVNESDEYALEQALALKTALGCEVVVASVGSLTAAKLGIPNAYAVTKVEAGSDPGVVRVTKELGGGVQQVLDVSLPAVLCIQSGGQPLSYAAPAKILRARRNPLKVVKLPDLGLDKATITQLSRLKIVDVGVPERKQQAEFLEGDTKKVAELLLGKIRGEGWKMSNDTLNDALTKADIIVSIGRGIGSKTNIPLYRHLAETLGRFWPVRGPWQIWNGCPRSIW
ncbi:MAG: FAD-binding protein [Chloroflexi bacterium]|nr:FAD-binding protein [Chloroflexota bacterium]